MTVSFLFWEIQNNGNISVLWCLQGERSCNRGSPRYHRVSAHCGHRALWKHLCYSCHHQTQVIFLRGKSKNLFDFRFGTCGLLLSIGAAGDILHQSSHYFMGYLMLSGKVFTHLDTCVYINIIPVIGLNMGVFMILFTAVDRLISVLFPIK